MPHNRFAVVLPWVQTPNAETEFGRKCQRAAANLGLECVLVDRCGRDLRSGQKVSGAELDFAISTHFTVPKVLDCFSFAVLNNPLQYYFDWNYDLFTERLLSHDDFLSIGSRSADDQVRRSLRHDPLHLAPQLFLYTAVSEPVIEPTVRQRRLFYISINWDRSRHRDLLQALDRQDLIEFYGPSGQANSRRRKQNWRGYRNYRGELPFDGRTVVEKIAEAGAVLAFSSEAHIRTEMMTSRLYEGLAAGAVVICDQNPFGRRHFGDSLLYVDTDRPDAAEQILAHLNWMNANPDKAAEMARAAQKIFRQRFSADFCLKNLYGRLDERKEALRLGLDPADATNPMVRVLYLLTDPSEQGWQRLRDFCLGQDYRRVQLQLLLEPGQQVDKALTKALKKRGIALKVQQVENLTERSTHRLGSVLAEGIGEALKEDDFDYLCALTSAEQPFANHLSSLLRLFKARPDCAVAATAEVFERPGPYDEREYTHLWSQSAVDFTADLDARPIGLARFMLRRDALEPSSLHLLPYLNRKALAALVVDRPLAQSSLATVLVDPSAPFFCQPADAEHEDPLIRQLHPGFASVAHPQTRDERKLRTLKRRQRQRRVGVAAVVALIGVALMSLLAFI